MNEYQLIKQIGECPKCGCKEFIVNSKVDGEVSYFVNLDGKECDNSEMYSGLDYHYDDGAFVRSVKTNYLNIKIIMLVVIFCLNKITNINDWCFSRKWSYGRT